jgi:hypothetical protein
MLAGWCYDKSPCPDCDPRRGGLESGHAEERTEEIGSGFEVIKLQLQVNDERHAVAPANTGDQQSDAGIRPVRRSLAGVANVNW